MQSGQLDDGFGRLSVARYCVFVRGVARDAAEMLLVAVVAVFYFLN